MATTLSNFSTALQIGTGATDIAVSAAGEKRYVGQLTFTNTAVTAIEVHLYKLATTATETPGSGGNWLIKRTIQPSKTWNVMGDVGNLVLSNEQTLSATAGTGAVINAECSGTVES